MRHRGDDTLTTTGSGTRSFGEKCRHGWDLVVVGGGGVVAGGRDGGVNDADRALKWGQYRFIIIVIPQWWWWWKDSRRRIFEPWWKSCSIHDSGDWHHTRW